jgi:predicted AlkP superfamily phosphohydrolase/phosphomutase
MKHLMTREPSDLTAIVFDGVDKIQHLAYRFLDPALAPARPTQWESAVIDRCRAYFRKIDDFLGQTRELVGKDGRIFIASDHGFTASSEIVYINRFLHDEGLLVWKKELEEDDKGTVFVDRLQSHLDLIDLQRTKAFALTPSSNGIFVNVPADEYHEFRAELVDKLYRIQGADGGAVVADVKLRDECFPGPYMNHAPDLTLTLRDFGTISVLNAAGVVIPRQQPWGTHHPDGVLLATGPGIQRGAETGPREIVEVASLLAHSLGLEIPADYEGRFPEDFYDAEYLAGDPPRISRACEAAAPEQSVVADDAHATPELDAEDENIVLQQLRNLGYLE